VLSTALTRLLGIDHPVIQASIGPWDAVELAAAVSNAGGLGTIGTATKSAGAVEEEIARLRDLMDAPFAVNHTMRPLDDDAYEATLEAQPPVISMALGFSAELVERAHVAGCLFIQQVHSVEQAERAAEAGVDAIIAQGGEAGGFGGYLGALALVPQVVDAVAPLPVVAAGGIFDGRGLAAALVLGAQGVNVGTRFLAAEETGVSDDWKRRIVEARSEDAVKVEFADSVFPTGGPDAFTVRPRALRTEFIDKGLRNPPDETAAERMRSELMKALAAGRAHELVPFTGETAGAIREVLPAAEILRRMVEGAEESLAAH
jgi:nitronate monooxygenase/enoyl-[acyl-carrier protein] reductase II